MKLYMHPVSTACRPIMAFLADNDMKVEQQSVDLMTGEQYGDAYAAVNPNHFVPVLDDGDFRLSESSAILKYLADKSGSSAYPKDAKQRARINEVMDWFNSNFYREYGYNFVYPQIFDHHRRASAEAQRVTLERGREQSRRFLKVLNDHYLSGGKSFLCGDKVSIADYFGAGILSLGELIGCGFHDFPNVDRWLKKVEAMPGWKEVNGTFNGMKESMKEKEFERI